MKKLILITICFLQLVVKAQWLPVNLNLSGVPVLQGKLFTDSKIALLSTGSNYYYKSFDRGHTWTFDRQPFGINFNAVASSAGGNILTMRNLSQYLLSTDRAATWYSVNTSLSSGIPVTEIEGSRQNIFYISTDKSLYRKTGNVDWLVKLVFPLATNENISKVEAFKDTGELLVATSTGKVYRSTDDGTTWLPSISTVGNINQLEIHDTNSISFSIPGTGQSRVFTSHNRGLTWDSLVVPFAIAEIHMSSRLNGVVKSTSSQLFHTSDGMQSWTLIPSLNPFLLGLTGEGNALLITSGALIYTSSNSGENWELNSELHTNAIRDIEVLADNSAYALTGTGGLYRSGNFGMTWQLIIDSLSPNLTRITREGDTSFLIHTPPGGMVLRYNAANGVLTDITAAFPPFDQMIYSYGNSLFAIKNKSNIHYSGDHGLTWTTRTVPDTANVNYFFAADSFFYIGSDNGTFYESSDRGATWSSKRLSTIANDKILFIYRNGLRLWACSKLSKMYFSKDGGIIWTPIEYKNTNRAFYCHKNLWLMQVTENEVVQTGDEGRTWQQTLFFPAQIVINSVKVNSRGFGLMLTSDGKILRMHNGGLPVELTSFNAEVVPAGVLLGWETASETNNHGFYIQRRNSGTWSDLAFIPGKGTSTERNTYSWHDDLKPQRGDTNFYRLKQVDLSGEFSYSNEVAVGFSPYTLELDQNFPNPFTINGDGSGSRTVIRFRLPEEGFATLKVYDSRGRVVEELFSGHANAGEYSFGFPSAGTSPASGVYFYELKFNGGVKRGKMLLLR